MCKAPSSIPQQQKKKKYTKHFKSCGGGGLSMRESVSVSMPMCAVGPSQAKSSSPEEGKTHTHFNSVVNWERDKEIG